MESRLPPPEHAAVAAATSPLEPSPSLPLVSFDQAYPAGPLSSLSDNPAPITSQHSGHAVVDTCKWPWHVGQT